MLRTFLKPALLSALVASFYGCNTPDSKKTAQGESGAPTGTSSQAPAKRDSLRFTQVRIVDGPNSTNSLSAPQNLKKAKRDWKDFYTDCRIAGNDYNIKEFDFLGVGNPKGLGSIIDEVNFVSRLPLNSDIFSEEELKKIVSTGGISACQSTTSKALVLNALFDGSLKIDNIDSDLKGVIESAYSNKKNLTFKVQGWQKAELNTAWLSYYLQSSPNLDKKAIYLRELTRDGNLIIAKAIYVKGFSFDIGLSKALTVNAQANLKASPTMQIGDLGFKLGLKSGSDKIINVSCTSDFIVYGYVMRAGEIR